MIKCPNKNLSEWKELEEIVPNVAYTIWDSNEYGIDKDSTGSPSTLFEYLLNIYNGDRVSAIKAKASIYSSDFINWSNSSGYEYSNNEPSISMYNEYNSRVNSNNRWDSNHKTSDPTLSSRLFKGKSEISVNEILSQIRKTNPSVINLVDFIETAIKETKTIGDIRIKLSNRTDKDGTSSAYYDENNRSVTILQDSEFKGKNGLADTTVLHEIIHTFTSNALMFNPSKKSEADKLFSEIVKQIELKYNKSSNQLISDNVSRFYGLTNTNEFFSELFANGKFVTELMALAPTGIIASNNDNIIVKLLDWISSLFNLKSTNNAYSESMNMLADLMFNYQNSLEGYSDVYKGLIRNDISEPTSDLTKISDILNEQKKHIAFNSENHIYTNTQTGEAYTPVSTVKDLNGYGADVSGMSDENLEYGSKAAAIGTLIHDFINSATTGDPENSDNPFGFVLTKQAKKMIKNDILPRILGNGKVVSSEQVISNDVAKIAGTVDRLIQDSNGNINLLDFKTKARNFMGTSKYGFDYYYSSKHETKKGGKPDVSRNDYQLTMYKRMLELSGIKINEKQIVPLEYNINENGEIYEVWISPSDYVRDNGTILLRDNYVLIQEINDTVLKQPISTNIEKTIETESLRTQSEIVNNILRVLRNQITLFNVKGFTTKSESVKDFVNKLNKMQSDEVVVAYVYNALKSLSSYIDEYNNLIKLELQKGDSVWNLKVLESWKNYADSFENLVDIQNYLFGRKDFLPEEDMNDLLTSLNTAINYKNVLQSSYRIKGEKKWLDWISNYSTFVEAEFRRKAEKEFKKNNKGSSTLNDKDALNNYITKYINEHRVEIDARTKELVRQQSKIANNDPINAFGRWIDTIFESKDLIVGSMSRAYHDKWLASHNNFNAYYRKLVDLTKELEKGSGSNYDPKELYNFMYEKYEGSVRLITKLSPKFEEDYNKIIEDVRVNPIYESQQDRAIAIAEWLNSKAPIIDKKGLAKVKEDALTDLKNSGIITESEYKILLKNEKATSSLKRNWNQLAKRGSISYVTADKVRDIFSKLNWDFRVPNKEEYPNKKWDDLQKLKVNNSNDIKVRYYNFISDLSTLGDGFVPNRFKLNNRLPGMAKSLSERFRTGDNIPNSIWQDVKRQFTIQADDTDKGMTEMTDELDRPVNFVPIYFTNRLPIEEQSLDIGTIYKEWFRSVNSYKYISEILPQLEFTKHVVNTRKTIATDANGNPVKNLLSKLNKKSAEGEVSENTLLNTSNLANQLNDWFDQVVYGKANKRITVGNIDVAKVIEMLNRYTSLKIMGINYISMVNNTLMAEIQQSQEAFAEKYISKKSYTKASAQYMMDLPNILGDVGSRKITSLTNLLNEYFGIFTDYNEGKMLDDTKFHKLFNTSSLYFTTQLGEHEAQSRFLQAALMEKRALDSKGNDIGSMFDYFEVIDGELMFDKDGKVDNFTQSEQTAFSQKISAIVRKMHGNYAPYSKVALQQNGFGKMALMFRKWIYTSWKRRLSGEYYDEFGQTFSKGYYRDGSVFLYNKVALFFTRFVNEAKALELAEKADWDTMTDDEKANVKRFTTEIAIYGSLMALHLAIQAAIEGEDDDEIKILLSNIDYQIYRLQTDMTFYINPASTLKILQSPMPSSSVIKSTSRLLDSLLDPTAKFEKGSWKGDYKIEKRVYDLIPVVRQIYRYRDIDDEKDLLKIF